MPSAGALAPNRGSPSVWRSSAAYRVRIALSLKQIAYRSVPIDLRTGEQSAGAYTALNPQGLIPALAIAAISSIVSGKPFSANWYSTKVLIYSGLLVIGLILRFVMRHWTETFRQLAVGGPNAALEAKLTREINLSRKLAYVYWIGIGTVAFIGVTKFF